MDPQQQQPPPDAPAPAGPAFRSEAAEGQFRQIASRELAALEALPGPARDAALAAMATDPAYGHFFAEPAPPPAPEPAAPRAGLKAIQDQILGPLRQRYGTGEAPPPPAGGVATPATTATPGGSLKDQILGGLRQRYGTTGG